jgi:hypothetical protein
VICDWKWDKVLRDRGDGTVAGLRNILRRWGLGDWDSGECGFVMFVVVEVWEVL